MNTRINSFHLIVIFLLFIFYIPLNCLSQIKFLEQSENKLIVKVNFPNLIIPKSTDKLPHLKESLFLLSDNRNLAIKILERKYSNISIKPDDYFVEDIPIGLGEDTLLNIIQFNDSEIFTFTYIGEFEDLELLKCHINSFDSENRKFLKLIKFEISGGIIKLIPDSLFYTNIDKLTQIQKKNVQSEIKKSNDTYYETDNYKLSGKKRLKIYIKNEGIYKLTGKSIENTGWALSEIETEYLQIISQSKQIPLRIIGTEDGIFNREDIIEFWGEPIWSRNNFREKCLDIYTDYNIYWLIVGDEPGLRIGNQAAVLNQENYIQQKLYPVSYPFTKHIEENKLFHRLPYAQNVVDEDHWLYSSSINGGEKEEFNFQINTPYLFSTYPLKIKCKLRGQCSQYDNHPIEFYLNNQFIGSTIWHSYDKILFLSNNCSPAHLEENDNNLTIVNKSSSGLFAQLYLDWFEITYPREFFTDIDFLLFNAPQNSENAVVHFEIKGYSHSDIHIYKKDNSLIYNPDIKAVIDTLGNTTYSVSFDDRIVDESIKYIALTKFEITIPDSIVFLEPNYLRSQEFGADYVIISPVDSLGIENEDVQDLISHRENQGLTVKVADLHDIYNEFNYGIPNPEAIRNFLRYTKLNWHPSPSFVLLVGDGTINPKASVESGNLIPVPLYQTVKYGGSPSDYPYSLLTENDSYPDISIGRLPVKNKSELSNIIQKIIDYEKNSVGPWRNDYLMISSGNKNGDFGYQAEYIINNIMNPSLNPKRMYLSGSIDDPFLGGTEDLLRHFRNGTAWINFRGHGGGAIWSDGGLLDLDDIPLLENQEKLPFITSMTCFTGDYASRKKSLGESLIVKDETGALAFFGSTGLGWVWNDYYLVKELYQCYTLFPEISIGELINKAKTAYLLKYQSNLALSEAYQFLLLGDPAVKLTLPAQKTEIKLFSQAVKKDNTVQINGKAESSNANINLSKTDSSYTAKYSETFTLDEINWNLELPIPTELYGSQCGIRAYLWDTDNNYQVRGFSPFSYGISFFDSLSVVPENPTFQDSLYFTVRIENVEQIKDVSCILELPQPDTLITYKVNNLFKTEKIPPFTPGTFIKFHFIVSNENGAATTSKTKEILIPLLAELRIQSVFLSGTDKVNAYAELINYGQTDANDVIVQFSSEEQGFYATDTVCIEESGTTTSSVTFYPVIGINTLTVIIDPDSLINEISKINNVSIKEIIADRFWITPEFGSTLDFNSTDTVGIQGKVMACIPPDAVNQPTSVSFDLLDQLPHNNSTAQEKVISEIYRIFFPGLNKDEELTQEALFLFYLDTVKSLKPYVWNNNLHNWIVCDYQKFDKYVQIRSTSGGYYSFLTSDDKNPPYIDVEVDNQTFVQDSYVSKNPLFNVLLQDESAIDLRPSSINVIIDGNEIQFSDLIIPDSTTSTNDINVSFRHNFEPGIHSLQIKAKDIHGNSNTSTKFIFKVGSDLRINYLGNHPNPFRVETVFVYVLTDVAKNVSLKIYTVSGKLIRNINDNTMASPDYHEIVWDGRDEWGNLIANGVYFFKLSVKGFDKTREVTGKIAKIR